MAVRCQLCADMCIDKLMSLAWDYEVIGPVGPWDSTYHYRHHESLEDMEASANTGCDFCRLVIETLKGSAMCSGEYYEHGPRFGQSIPYRWIGEQAEAKQPTMYSLAKSRHPNDVKVRIWSSQWSNQLGYSSIRDALVIDMICVQIGVPRDDADDGCPELLLDITIDRGVSCSYGATRLGIFEVDSDLASTVNFNLARSFLNDCLHTHASCSFPSERCLPSRVLDVGTCHTDPIRLYSSSLGQKGDYVALSHCWGGVVSPMLTSVTRSSFLNGVHLTELPQNFQDAVRITRELGLRYLWIDSLCIIQDSKADWEYESKRMCDVYRYSYVTIYALVSTSSSSGILNADTITPPHDPKPAKVRISNSSTAVEEVTLSRNDLNRLELLSELLDDDAQDHRAGVLSTRGWTLQEMTLSPRQLFYGNKQMHWRCLNGCESANGFRPGNDAFRFGHGSYFEMARLFHQRTSDPALAYTRNPSDPTFILHYYYRLIMTYARRDLTYDSDKLPAISGIAQVLQPLLNADYLAGIWSSDFRRGLLWYRGRRNAQKQSSTYRAPSWSWAVSSDVIIFPGTPTTLEVFPDTDVPITLQNYTIVPVSTGNVYGELRSASITLQGHTIRFLRSSQVIEGINRNSSASDMGNCTFDDPTSEELSRSAENPVFRATASNGQEYLRSVVGDVRARDWANGEGKFVDYYEIFKNAGEDFEAEECLALVVHARDEHRDLRCLILRPVLNTDKSLVYQRVGVLSRTADGLDINWLRSWDVMSVVIV